MMALICSAERERIRDVVCWDAADGEDDDLSTPNAGNEYEVDSEAESEMMMIPSDGDR